MENFSRDLTGSIAKPEGFFVGAFRPDYTRRCIPASSIDVDAGSLVVQWSGNTAAGGFRHAVRFHPQATFGEAVETWFFPMCRVACHFIVDKIPDEGLRELAETLGDLYEFYAARSEQPPQLRHDRVVNTRVVECRERPAFYVTEE